MKKVLAFTLVELLIVIAVIAILSSLLLPALNQAKEKGRQILCLNNLKQCNIATFAYSNDYGGYAPSFHQNGCFDFLGIGIMELRWSAALYAGGYLTTTKTAWCPTDFEASYNRYPNIDNRPYDAAVFSYGMFTSLGVWYNITKEKNPSRTPIYADSIYFYTFAGYDKWCFASYINWNAPPVSVTDRTVHLRHQGASGNAAFADGHVSSLNAADFKESGIGGGRSKYYMPLAF